MKSIALFVVGAKGLLAAETLRLAAAHPNVVECHAFSRTPLADLRVVHPHLPQQQTVRALTELPDALAEALLRGPAAVILATPHGVAKKLWLQLQLDLALLEVDCDALRVIDLSDDHRLGPLEDSGSHPDQIWHYGLPELHPIPADARRVAVAGCFATAMQLAVMPLERAGLLQAGQPLILHGVTASSGSGAQAQPGTHHPYRRNDFHPYALDGHRHEKELCHARNFLVAPSLVFLPYSAPLGRGIYLTAHLPLHSGVTPEQLQEAFDRQYCASPFVELCAAQAPHLRAVVGSNRAAIGWHQRTGFAQVFVALDNTIKGGAGQGLQCLNLMFGLPETTGLPLAGLGY